MCSLLAQALQGYVCLKAYHGLLHESVTRFAPVYFLPAFAADNHQPFVHWTYFSLLSVTIISETDGLTVVQAIRNTTVTATTGINHCSKTLSGKCTLFVVPNRKIVDILPTKKHSDLFFKHKGYQFIIKLISVTKTWLNDTPPIFKPNKLLDTGNVLFR